MTAISTPAIDIAANLQSAMPSTERAGAALLANKARGSNQTEELREAFTNFVGQTFFGQMIKAMRSTVDKPAYFHGGRGEEVFQSMMDQTLAEEFTEASADRFAEPMFNRQFPHLADRSIPKSQLGRSGLDDLSQLSRR